MEWNKYLIYLCRWVVDHSDDKFKGMTPASYNEWLECEGYECEGNEMTDDLKLEVLIYARAYANVIGLDMDGDFVHYKGTMYYVHLGDNTVKEAPDAF